MAATLAPALIGTATGFLARHFGDDQIEDMLGQGDVTCGTGTILKDNKCISELKCGPGTILKDDKCLNLESNIIDTQCYRLDTAACEISKFCKEQTETEERKLCKWSNDSCSAELGLSDLRADHELIREKCTETTDEDCDTYCADLLNEETCEADSYTVVTSTICNLQDKFINAKAIEFQNQLFCNDFDKTTCPPTRDMGPMMCKVDGEKCVPDFQ